jgi:hypothetical protein
VSRQIAPGDCPRAPALRATYKALTDYLLHLYPIGFLLELSLFRFQGRSQPLLERKASRRASMDNFYYLLLSIPFGLAILFMLWVLWHFHMAAKR